MVKNTSVELGTDPASGDVIKVFKKMDQLASHEQVIVALNTLLLKMTIFTSQYAERAIQLTIPKIIGLINQRKLGISENMDTMRHNGKNIPIDNNENISLDDAKKIIDGTFEKKSNVIKEFERGVKVMNGKYGPYLNFNKKNYKIPKNINPQEITYKECQSIINK